MSSKSAKTGASLAKATGDNKKQQQQQRPKVEADGAAKRQAIPSQKRASQERQRRQQLGATGSNKLNGQQTHELDTKVGQLTDKNEACREKIRLKLDEFSRSGSEIKDEIARTLERQAGVLAKQASVVENVEQLRIRMLELSQPEEPLFELEAGEKRELTTNGRGEELLVDDRNLEEEPTRELSSSQEEDGQPEVENSKRTPAAHPSPESGQANGARLTDTSRHEEDLLIPSNCFEPLTARLDPKTKLITLKASLERHFDRAPELLEPICNRLLMLSRQIDVLVQQNDRNQSEIAKLMLIKTKLSDLCRELQKSNNQIRIESLGMIKGEQQRAREQAAKIQSTLAGVMKLFDENQQKNLALKQENVELQTKLKALLDHCGQWEQCVETALKQRDIENCLLKTELKRLHLIRTEEQERFLKEKQSLLKMVEIMRSHQGKIEDKEAKLREDLSSYASKYDQCQEIIQSGLGKFQVESKRMLKQIEKSRHDYVALLNKYETSNKKIKELLEEKQTWAKSMVQANKKLEALERLCRSLKQENDKLLGKGDTAEGTAAEQPPQVPVACEAGEVIRRADESAPQDG